jgi:putative transposase
LVTKTLRSYKTEINPTPDQAVKINRTIGVCRFVYNLYLRRNEELHEAQEPFMSAMSFSKWLNNEFIPNNPSYGWVKEVSSKAVKQSIFNAERAYRDFFRDKKGFPRYKKRSDNTIKMYLPRNNAKDWATERHRIKIPTLGFVRLKEYGYIPPGARVTSGTVSRDAGRYFVSVLCEVNIAAAEHSYSKTGIGIDLGIKNLAVCSDGSSYGNINKTKKVKSLTKRLKRQQRSLSRKLHARKKRKEKDKTSANINKNTLRVQVYHRRLQSIRIEYVRLIVNSLVKANNLPSYVSIEDLNVSGMMKNRHLSKAIQQQMFYYFRKYLEERCRKYGVELRTIDRFYPSSKMCHECGAIKSDLKLSDRVYKCECGNIIDRDYQASMNIRDCGSYKVA